MAAEERRLSWQAAFPPPRRVCLARYVRRRSASAAMVNAAADDAPRNCRGDGQLSPATERSTTCRKSSDDCDDCLSEYGDELNGLQRLAVCRLNGPAAPRVEQDKRMRREIANSNERRRMQSINAGFQTLRALLPQGDGEKMSKASILMQTADLIQSLRQQKSDAMDDDGCRSAAGRSTETQTWPADTEQMETLQPAVVPPKKRRKYYADSADSSDEGVGMLLEETELCVVGGASAEAALTLELLKTQLIEVQLAYERERQLRLVLQEQVAAANCFGRLHVSPLPLVELAATAPSRTSESKQSLQAIVEAIRHLEGDQLFVDAAVRADSGVSSPVAADRPPIIVSSSAR